MTLQMADVSTGKIDQIENETYVGAIEDLDEPLCRLASRFAEIRESSAISRKYKL